MRAGKCVLVAICLKPVLLLARVGCNGFEHGNQMQVGAVHTVAMRLMARAYMLARAPGRRRRRARHHSRNTALVSDSTSSNNRRAHHVAPQDQCTVIAHQSESQRE